MGNDLSYQFPGLFSKFSTFGRKCANQYSFTRKMLLEKKLKRFSGGFQVSAIRALQLSRRWSETLREDFVDSGRGSGIRHLLIEPLLWFYFGFLHFLVISSKSRFVSTSYPALWTYWKVFWCWSLSLLFCYCTKAFSSDHRSKEYHVLLSPRSESEGFSVISLTRRRMLKAGVLSHCCKIRGLPRFLWSEVTVLSLGWANRRRKSLLRESMNDSLCTYGRSYRTGDVCDLSNMPYWHMPVCL